MESVEQIIEYILEQSQFDLGRVDTVGGQSSRSWASRPAEVVSVQELRHLLGRKDSGDADLDRAREAQLICREETISKLVARLRILLKDYVDTENDTIGHAFPRMSLAYANQTTIVQEDGLRAESCITALGVFAKALVKGSALVGSGTVGSLLAGWVKGQTVRYRTCAILNGIHIKAAIEPVAGIRIVPFPWSSYELPSDLPFLSSRGPEDYLGRTVIYVDTIATPPLFRPGPDGDPNPVHASSESIANVDAVCEALALESDDFVDVAFQWNEYIELQEVFPNRNSSTWSRYASRLRSHLKPGWSTSINFETGVVTLSPAEDSLSELMKQIWVIPLGH